MARTLKRSRPTGSVGSWTEPTDTQLDLTVGEFVGDVLCIAQRPGKAVEFGHDQGVPGPAGGQCFPQPRPGPVGTGQALVGEGLLRRHPKSGQGAFCAVRSWSLVDTRARPRSPVVVLNIPFMPPSPGIFSGGPYGNRATAATRAIMTRKCCVSLAPEEDRLAGMFGGDGPGAMFRMI